MNDKIYIRCDRFPSVMYTEDIINPNEEIDNFIKRYIDKYAKYIYYTNYKIYDYNNFFEHTNPIDIPLYLFVGDLKSNNLYLVMS